MFIQTGDDLLFNRKIRCDSLYLSFQIISTRIADPKLSTNVRIMRGIPPNPTLSHLTPAALFLATGLMHACMPFGQEDDEWEASKPFPHSTES